MGEFRKAIDNEIAKIEAEQKEQQERKAAAKSQLQKAREKAVIVRDKIIIPLLNSLRNKFFADPETKKVLPNWQVQSDGNVDRGLWNCRNTGGFRWCAAAILHDQAWSICSGVWR